MPAPATTRNAADEPPIDSSLTHYMEARALAVALEKAATPAERVKVERLSAQRAALMERRDAFMAEATARRHARGEVYSQAQVAAINAMGQPRSEMDRSVKDLYLGQPDCDGVLQAHALTHFAYGLVSGRLRLADNTADIAEAARGMQVHEETFAAAWVAAIGDAAFETKLRRLQLEALNLLRTSTRAMHLVTHPVAGAFDDLDAQALGKAWNKLDALAQAIGVEPLSAFLALPGDDPSAGFAAERIAPTVAALLEAVQSPGQKLPAKRATVSVLAKVRDALALLGGQDGRACFEADF